MQREYYFRGIDDILRQAGSESNKLLVNKKNGYVTATFQSERFGTILTSDPSLVTALRGFSKRVAELRIEELTNKMEEEKRNGDTELVVGYERAIWHEQNILYGCEKYSDQHHFLNDCLVQGLGLSAFIAPYTNCEKILLGVTIPNSNPKPKIWVAKSTFLEAYETLNSIGMDLDLLKLIAATKIP